MRWTVGCALILWAFASTGWAQSTGASFGGGSWGSGSSGSSSWSSGSSSWSSGSSGSSSWGSGSSGSSSSSWDGASTSGAGAASGGGFDAGALCLVLGLVWVAYFFWRAARKMNAASAPATPAVPRYLDPSRPAPRPPTSQGIDVSVLMIGIDWRARRFVQQRLMELAGGDTGSNAGLAELLHETCRLLLGVELGWLYAGAYDADPMPQGRAQQEFLRMAQDLRSRFRHELVRNADGTSRTASTPSLRARAEEGEGVVVVSLLVAARADLRNLLRPRDAQALKQVLAQLGRLGPEQLVALEVIWSPAAEDDRMSTAELEVLYPELRRIDERTVAGRVFCVYCGGPYAAELRECPHCGAPRPAS